jgi:type VI protein secretion system component VasK
MSKPKPDVKRIYASIAVAFAWLLFLALWLFYYATNYNLIQNWALDWPPW